MQEIITQFHFIRPIWLLMLAPSLILFLWALRSYASNSQWTQHIHPKFLPYLLEGRSENKKRYPLFALVVIWFIAIFALAGPTWQQQEVPLIKNADALVIVWDLSPSMSVEDIKPSRLVRSRLKIMDLLEQHTDGLVGLVVYAGEAHVVTPLTDDVNTIKSLLSGLNPDIMPVSGSNTEMALSTAQRLLKDANIFSGNILFITDGITEHATQNLLNNSEKSRYNVSFWGIGTSAGGPIPLSRGGFAKNNRGEIVIARLDENNLSELAQQFNGIYVPFSNTNNDIETLLNFKLQKTTNNTKETTRNFDQWIEVGPYLLIVLLPFLAFTFRRGWLLTIMVGICFYPSDQTHAISSQDLWLTPDQQANKALQNGDAQKAAELFKNPSWRGIANYEAKNYEEAKNDFAQGTSAVDAFNLGKTHIQLEEYEAAANAFERALELDPNMEAAKKNKQISQQLAELKKQQQDGQPQDGQQDGQQQDGQQQDGQQQDGQQQDGQQQDGQQGDTNQKTAEEKLADASQKQSENISKNDVEENSQSLMDKLFNRDKDESDEEKTKKEQQITEAEQKDENLNGDQQAMANALDPNSLDPSMLDPNSVEEVKTLTEAEQSLNQWLRKIPDDPSGLLRTKFDHQHKQRLQEFRSGRWQPPNADDDQRW